jgi:hypothetical protein
MAFLCEWSNHYNINHIRVVRRVSPETDPIHSCRNAMLDLISHPAGAFDFPPPDAWRLAAEAFVALRPRGVEIPSPGGHRHIFLASQ